MLFVAASLALFMTAMRFAVYYFFGHQGNEFPGVLKVFMLGLRFDMRTVAIILLLMLLIGNIPKLRPFNNHDSRVRWVRVIAVVFGVILFFYIIDFAHISYLGQRLNASVLNLMVDAGISLNMVWESYPVFTLVLILLFVSVMYFLLVRLVSSRIRKVNPFISTAQRWVEAVCWIIVLGSLIFGSISQYPLRWSDAFGLGTDYRANLALNPFESFFNTLKFRNNKPDLATLRKYYPELNKYYHFTSPVDTISFARKIQPKDSLAETPNIVLIIGESFSAYKSSSFGNPEQTTPFFDSLARQGLFFDRCFSPTFGTARGVWATLISNPDVESPATASRNPAAVDQRTILNSFTGLDKFYFLGGSTSWANLRGILNNNIQGVNIYEQESFGVPKVDVWGISDKNLFLETNKILAKHSKPFFAVIQTADNHRPFTIPQEDLMEFKLANVPAATYRAAGFASLDEFNAFRYTDFCFRKFMEAASKEAYFKNTIFVLTGDHGVPGNAGGLFPKVWTEQRLTQHHVPLLYYAPAIVKPSRQHRIASQIDLLPTLAGLCKIPYTNYSLGRDLMDTANAEQFAFLFDMDNNQVSIIDSQYLYRKQIHGKKEDLYSIINNDPVPADSTVEARKRKLRILSEGMYEAGKYLLINNKKDSRRKALQ